MNKFSQLSFLLSSMVLSLSIQAQETIEQTSQPKVEVGKHVAGNLDATSMILSLLMVLALIIFSAWLLKKVQGGQHKQSQLKIVTSLHLGAKERLMVVQVGKKQLLLGLTGQQINLLDTLDEPLEIQKAMPQEFNNALSKFLNKNNGKATHE